LMRHALNRLAAHFYQVAVPQHGRYVEHPTNAISGTAYARRGK
jgi:hypothetical protein